MHLYVLEVHVQVVFRHNISASVLSIFVPTESYDMIQAQFKYLKSYTPCWVLLNYCLTACYRTISVTTCVSQCDASCCPLLPE